MLFLLKFRCFIVCIRRISIVYINLTAKKRDCVPFIALFIVAK